MQQTKEKPSHKHGPAKPEDKVPFLEKVSMGGGGLAQMITDHGIKNLANQVYNMLLGLNPAVISSVFGAVRLWDAITDPVMGTISDNTRSKFGRRRPYIFAGAILCGIGFPLVWFVPASWTGFSLGAYFVVASFVFYTFATVYGVSFQALLTEMTPSYSERTRVTSVVYFFQSIGWIIFPLAFWVSQFDLFGDPITGVRIVTSALGLFIAALGISCAVKAKERYQKVASQQEKVPIIKGLKESLKNKPFVILIALTIFMQLGNQMVNTLGQYLGVYYVFDGDIKAGARLSVIIATMTVPLSMLVVAVGGHYFADFEKRKILMVGMCFALAGTISKWWTVTPEHPYLMLIPPALLTPGNAAFWMLVPSMRADVCDDDELKTGTRSEGIYSSIHTWVMKLAVSIVIVLSGFLLVWVGFDEELGGDQSKTTIFLMHFLYTIIPTISIGIAIVLLWKYPLTKERMREIRDALEQRREEVT